MRNFKSHLKKILKYHKLIIAMLVVASFSVSASTFAYWTIQVQGTYDETSMVFHIGEYLKKAYQFMMTEEDETYQYEVDIDYLLEDYENNSEEVLFGVVWNDPSLSDEFKDQIVTGEIEMDIDIKYYYNGNQLSWWYERWLDRYIGFELTQSSDSITYNGGIEDFMLNIALNSNKNSRQVEYLRNFEVYIEVTYTVNH